MLSRPSLLDRFVGRGRPPAPRPAPRPAPEPVAAELADDIDALEDKLTASRVRVRYLEQRVDNLREHNERLLTSLNEARAERGMPAIDLVPDVDDLLGRISRLEADNTRLLAGGANEEVLRERETSRRLHAEVHRLTMANIAADKAVR